MSQVIHGFVVERAENLSDEQRENNRKWVEALRSGKYKQTREKLRNKLNGRCCLGVAEEVLGCTWIGKRLAVRGDDHSFVTLTPASQRDLGALEDIGFYVEGISLADLNDRHELGFPALADIIAYWAGLEEGQ